MTDETASKERNMCCRLPWNKTMFGSLQKT